MISPNEKPAAPPQPPASGDADFAEEGGPKETEFKKEKDAKEISSEGFETLP